MPITVLLQQREVSLTAQTKPILDSYQEALKKTGFRLEASDEGASSLVAVGDKKQRSGIWANYVLNTLEVLDGRALGANFVLLPAVDINLDPPAEILFSEYRYFLNQTLQVQNSSAKETEKSKIDSPYVLVRELLLRFVGIALCDKLDPQHDGDGLLLAMESFMKTICREECLIERNVILPNRLSKFLKKLLEEHPKWQMRIRHLVGCIKTLHANRQILTHTLNMLKKAERVIQGHLVVFLSKEQDPALLTDDWVDNALQDAEDRLLSQIKHDRQRLNDASCALAINYKEVNEKSYKVLVYLSAMNKDQDLLEHTQHLYRLLNKTAMLYEIMSHIDLLMSCTGWMPVLSGLISFDNLAKQMDQYGEECCQTLKIPVSLKKILETPLGHGLVRYQAVRGEGLAGLALDSAQNLSKLMDARLKKRMMHLIRGTVFALVDLQRNLPVEHYFIHLDVIQKWDSSMVLGQSEKLAITQEPDPSHGELVQLQKENRQLQLMISQREDAESSVLLMTDTLHSMLMEGCNQPTFLDILLKQGAALDYYCRLQNSYQGYTALHIAAATNNVKICKWLIEEKKIDVNLKDVSEKTALDKACECKHTSTMTYLREQGGKSEYGDERTRQLHHLIGQEEVTEEDSSVTKEMLNDLIILLAQGADINGANELPSAWRGDLPLHTVAVKGNRKLIDLFIHMGADPCKTEPRKGETTYQRVKRVKRPEEAERVFQIMIDAGAKKPADISSTNVSAHYSHFKPVSKGEEATLESSSSSSSYSSSSRSEFLG